MAIAVRTGTTAAVHDFVADEPSPAPDDVPDLRFVISGDFDNAWMGYPAVAEAAVTASPGEKGSGRPLACIVLKGGPHASPVQPAAALPAHGFAKWQLLERYATIGTVRRTSTGKLRKLELREQFPKQARRHSPFCYRHAE